jgi:hypothetical protein
MGSQALPFCCAPTRLPHTIHFRKGETPGRNSVRQPFFLDGALPRVGPCLSSVIAEWVHTGTEKRPPVGSGLRFGAPPQQIPRNRAKQPQWRRNLLITEAGGHKHEGSDQEQRDGERPNDVIADELGLALQDVLLQQQREPTKREDQQREPELIPGEQADLNREVGRWCRLPRRLPGVVSPQERRRPGSF